MESTPKNRLGFTDAAATDDIFNIKRYTDGLCKFIMACRTPMTISIQGTWGTGKTSMMNFIQKEIGARTLTVPFNTWQYSQFNQQDMLAASLIERMMAELKASPEIRKKVSVRKIVTHGVVAGLSLFNETAGEHLGRVVDATENGDDQIDDSATALAALRDNFKEAVSEALEKADGIDRIVFYIDDLDRLEPRKAVELLEVLKLFFDVEGCVFILAIDYDVVVKGVTAKYGKFSENDDENEAKGRSFFDKIIQVPFKLPVGEYDISEYIKTCLKEIGIPTSENDLPNYERLIRYSVGTNPRSMKRIFNAYLLLSMVKEQVAADLAKGQMILFAFLCLQHAYEGVYNYMLKNRSDIGNVLSRMADEEDEATLRNMIGAKELRGVNIKRLQEFLSNLFTLIDENRDSTISDEEVKVLWEVLNISTMTSASSSDDNMGTVNTEEPRRRKKVSIEYNEKQYVSGSRSGNNIGNLVHDILSDVISKNQWTVKECAEFRETFYKKGKTGWLNEVLLFDYEVAVLPSDSNWRDAPDAKDENGNNRTVSMEQFGNYYSNSINIKDGETAVYTDKDMQIDSNAIRLYDGRIVFTARYFGDKDVDKVCDILRTVFGVEIGYERSYL